MNEMKKVKKQTSWFILTAEDVEKVNNEVENKVNDVLDTQDNDDFAWVPV